MRALVQSCLLLIAIMLFGTPAHASPEGKRIAALTTLNTQPFIGMWTATFTKTAEALGMKVTNYTTPFDAALQSQQVDDAIAQKFDLIVVIVVNHQAILPALTRAKAAGVPVIIAVGPLEKGHEDLYLSNVGTDQTRLGRLAAENLVKGLAEEGKTKAQVAAVTGIASQLQTQLRMAGFKEVLAQHPDIKLVAEEDGKWNTAPSEAVTSQILVRFAGRGGIDGIMGMADNQASGVIQAINSAGMKAGIAGKGIVVVASNCTKDGVIHIRDGSQYGTNTQLPQLEAKMLGEKLADYFNGKTLKKNEFVQTVSITKANIDQYAEACSF